eukprot:1806334-Prymnesium_polylepis.2
MERGSWCRTADNPVCYSAGAAPRCLAHASGIVGRRQRRVAAKHGTVHEPRFSIPVLKSGPRKLLSVVLVL